MKRLLPPLLLLAVLATLAVRTALRPSRGEARARIAGYVQGMEKERAHQELAAYLQRFTDTEDRWFAARMYLHARAPGRAISAIWDDERLAADPATNRRFGRTALYSFGWMDEARDEPSVMEPLALTMLVEGGDPWARARLLRLASTLELADTTTYFFPAYRNASSPPMAALVEGYRTRADDRFETAAALGALHAEDYPDKARDLKRLQEVMVNESWRRRYRDVWCVACIALGRSGDAAALDALRRAEARLEASQRRRDREDLLLVRNGLIAAGQWEAEAALLDHVYGDAPAALPTVWYGEALIHRYRAGDERSEASLMRYWQGPGAKFPDLRDRLARAFLLQDRPPSDDAAETWVQERMLPGLEEPDMPLMSHVLAQAYRLRMREPGAREALLETLRSTGRALGTKSKPPQEISGAFLEALRALYLYG